MSRERLHAPNINAMAFYHEKGMHFAWKQAARFIGEEGHMGTMLDIVDARLAAKAGTAPWETWYTTTTAEYLGYSRSDNLILIVAHGVGPMSTLKGIEAAYSWETKDEDRNRRGGRITQQQFWDLESGKFGDVYVVDAEQYRRQPWRDDLRSHFDHGTIRTQHAMIHQLLGARLGPRAEELLQKHKEISAAWVLDMREQHKNDPRTLQALGGGVNPFICSVGIASNCPYFIRKVEDGMAFAHLLSTGRLGEMHHSEGRSQCISLVLDYQCHEWGDGVRLIGVRGKPVRKIHGGLDLLEELMRRNWKRLLVPTKQTEPPGFCVLTNFPDRKGLWTEYPKKGERLDTGAPMCLVTAHEPMGRPVTFTTMQSAYPGFFKYGIQEVRAIAPQSANAYMLVGDPWLEGDKACSKAQFYRVDVDVSQRLMREEAIRDNFELLMGLVEAA